MSNIISFTPRPKQAAVEQSAAIPTAKPVSTTAAEQVVSALKFYARQGYDGGEKARKALLGMVTVVDAGNTDGERA